MGGFESRTSHNMDISDLIIQWFEDNGYQIEVVRMRAPSRISAVICSISVFIRVGNWWDEKKKSIVHINIKNDHTILATFTNGGRYSSDAHDPDALPSLARLINIAISAARSRT